MILRVDIRGNGEQLADYVVKLKDNDHIEILEVDGHEQADKAYLQQTILEMQLTAELTRSDKAFFHTQINPAYGEDRAMTREDWYQAADILAKETGYQNQRRVIVLHSKKGRTHAHVIWERYNHETGKMIDNKHSVFKADAARPKIEAALGHKQTPRRNPHRPELKAAVTKIWNESSTAPQFIKNMRKAGYIVAAGTGNRPFMVVDENGRSFNLVRQINGANTSDVRNLLRHEKLMTDKEAIELMRELQSSNSGKRERQQIELKPTSISLAESFAETRNDITPKDPAAIDKRKAETAFAAFKTESQKITQPPQSKPDERQRKQTIAAKFADNGLGGKPTPAEQELAKQKLIAEQQRIRQQKRERGRHR